MKLKHPKRSKINNDLKSTYKKPGLLEALCNLALLYLKQ